jgi:hypothetical protein
MLIRFVGSSYLVLLAGLVFMLYHTSYRIDEARSEVRHLERAVDKERAAIDVLQAEWSVRTSPEHVKTLV